MGCWETWPIILDQHSFKRGFWPRPPCFHLNSFWTIWNRSLNILCEPSLLSSLRHPSLKFFKVFYQGACLRDSSLQAGWPTYSSLPSLFTLVSCSFLFPFTRAYLLIYRLLSHSPSIILFCAIYTGFVLMYFLRATQLCSLTRGDNLSYRTGNSNNSKTY